MSTSPTVRPPEIHKLKMWPGDFEATRLGLKTCEVRRCDDRKFRVNDVLELREFDPEANAGAGAFSGRLIRVRLTHIDRMAGPRMLVGVGRSSLEDVVPVAILSFGKLST